MIYGSEGNIDDHFCCLQLCTVSGFNVSSFRPQPLHTLKIYYLPIRAIREYRCDRRPNSITYPSFQQAEHGVKQFSSTVSISTDSSLAIIS